MTETTSLRQCDRTPQTVPYFT